MAATATIACPLVFALWVVCQYLIAGIREKGFLRFFREALFPAGRAMGDLLYSFAIAAHRINNCATTFAYNSFVCEYDCWPFAGGHLFSIHQFLRGGFQQ